MVIERAELFIKPGREADFERAIRGARAILTGAPGCLSATVGRGIESPSKYVLLLEWNSLEDHAAFTETPEFELFRDLVGSFFAARPSMEHFAPLGAE